MRAQDVRLTDDVTEQLRDHAKSLSAFPALWNTGPAMDSRGRRALGALVERLRNMYPYGDSRYIGQIIKPPHPVAWAAYSLTALLNPNNHALDGGPATAELEKEAVAALAVMFGFDQHLGHLTSSGTIANLEALWVARESHPDKVIVSGCNAHYTHGRMCALIDAKHEYIDQDLLGRLDMEALERRLAHGDVGTVVVTLGTTGLAALDEVHVAADLTERYGVRLHVDAAYGGFHSLLADDDEPLVDPRPFHAVRRADSVVVDPHKHGLQPYGCGAVLFSDPRVGRFYSHDSPYTYFSSNELHLGEISLECSRAGAAAAAFWTTIQAIGLDRDGLGSGLADGRRATLEITELIRASSTLDLVLTPQLDMVCFYPKGPSSSEISARSEAAFAGLGEGGWHAALLRVDSQWLQRLHPEVEVDSDYTTVLRCCVMKPEHLGLVNDFVAAATAVAAT